MYAAAAVQMTATSDAQASVAQAKDLIRLAARRGARLILTPENTNFLGPHDAKVRLAEPVDGPLIQGFAALARELGVHLVIGSFNERSEDARRCYNTSVAIGPDGSILATYRKLHLFDVDVSPELRFRESDTILPGDEVVVVPTELGVLGLSICYDLRFPELYRALVDRGAQVLLVPAAFTLTTGRDHWHPLLQARAIECQAWVLAAGQCGRHDDGGLRESFGHSLVLDPWGHQVALASDGPGLAMGWINLDQVAAVRARIPVANHRRV